MIKFFRQIRQKLVQENRLSKYLLYAIGEIILVVIGILIALQINTRKDELNNLKLEDNYVQRLINDFQKDSLTLEKIISETKTRIDLGKGLVQTLDSGIRDSLSINLAEAVEYTMWFNYPNYSRSTYTDLTSTGNFRLIRDAQLKDMLSNYYSTIEFTEQWKENFRNIQYNVEVLIPKILSLEQREELYNHRRNAKNDFHVTKNESKEEDERVIKAMLEIPDTREMYSNMVRIQIVHLNGLETILDLADSTLHKLRNYHHEE